MVFPIIMVFQVSQLLALATPHGCMCHSDHLQFDHHVNVSRRSSFPSLLALTGHSCPQRTHPLRQGETEAQLRTQDTAVPRGPIPSRVSLGNRQGERDRGAVKNPGLHPDRRVRYTLFPSDVASQHMLLRTIWPKGGPKECRVTSGGPL